MAAGRNTLSKSERLCSEKRIGALFAGGRRGGAGPLKFCCIAGAADDDAQVGGVSVLFSVPKKVFKRAWKRNLIKRRMRDSYRCRKHELAALAAASGRHIDIAFICSPVAEARSKNAGGGAAAKKDNAVAAKKTETVRKKGGNAKKPVPEIPDFKTIDNAIGKILDQILARS
ncbi:MAG: ribonuclease P protein component [Alistipes sp.]|nr:ribonuclease P protein component [Alistipes sp.]